MAETLPPPSRIPESEISSDVQRAPTRTRRTTQTTLGFIKGISEVEIVVYHPEIDGDECFRRVRRYEVQRERDRRESSRLLDRNYPV
jgi:hypothetical protein